MKDRMLCAIGHRESGVVLAFEGDNMRDLPGGSDRSYDGCRIEFELNEFSVFLDEHFFTEHLPCQPGLYVWEGNITYNGDDGDAIWRGQFRPATLSDVSHFKIGLIYD